MPTPSELLKNSPRHSIFGNYRAENGGRASEGAGSRPTLLQAGPKATAPTLQTAIDQAIARSFIYRFLAKAFEDGEPESWHWLTSEQTRLSLAAVIRALLPLTPALSPSDGERENYRQSDAGTGADGLSERDPLLFPLPLGGGEGKGEGARGSLALSFGQLNEAFTPSAFDTFSLAYLTCFGHTVRGDCPMNEIEYGDIKADPLFQPHRLSDLGAFYAAFGLQVTPDAAERVDHISIELEFMSVLAAKEAYAIEHQFDAEQLDLLRDAQKKFLREHLGRWTPAFTRRLAKMAADTPLGVLAQWTGEFVKVECARLNVPPGSEDLLLRPVDEASESLCASCGLAALPPGAATTGPM